MSVEMLEIMGQLLKTVRMIRGLSPELAVVFRSLESSLVYSAPEQLPLRADIFNELMNDNEALFSDEQMQQVCDMIGCSNPRTQNTTHWQKEGF